MNDAEDISSRLLMNPIFQIIDEAKSKGRIVHAKILRPGLWDDFTKTLEQHPFGYFHTVHFDCHGWVRDGTACLDFARFSGETECISALEVASCLKTVGVAVVNLNACSSATVRQASTANLALCFARSGIPTTIAMSYDILDSAASIFEEEFYRSWLLDEVEDTSKKSIFDLFKMSQPKFSDKLVTFNNSVVRAVSKARIAMRERSTRLGLGGWEISLRDYIVPVIYTAASESPSHLEDLALSSMADSKSRKLVMSSKRKKWLGNVQSPLSNVPLHPAKEVAQGSRVDYHPVKAELYKLEKNDTMYSSLQPRGFRFTHIDPPIVGRDRAIAEVEALTVQPQRNIVFLEGRAGSGKSILVRHICDWWKSTGHVEDFFYIDCRKYTMLEEAHDYPPCSAPANNMMYLAEDFIFSALFPKDVPRFVFNPKKTRDEHRKRIIDKLRSGRYLLVFDNADFRITEKDGKMTPMKSLTIGSSLICRDSVIQSAVAVAHLESFIRDIHTGNSVVLFTARYKRWYLDYLSGVTTVMYSPPKLTLSACLTIGERKY